MGNHRFRLSHVMPNVWFYKLRDMGIGRNRTNGMMMNKRLLSNAPRKMRSPESAIRRSFELAQRGGQTFRYNPGFNLQYPRYQGEITSTTKTSFNKSISSKKNSNSTVIDSSISAGCNCRTSVVSKKSKEENSVEDSVVSRKYKEEKLLDVPKRKNVMKMQKPSKHVLQYGFNKVAGLPSPVHEDEEEDNDINSSFLLENSGYVVSEKPCSCKACRDAISLRFEPSPIKTSYSLSQYQDEENMNNTNSTSSLKKITNSTSNLKKNANSTSNLKNIANVTRSLKDGISSEKLPPKAMKISQRTKNSHAKSKKNSKKQSPISSGFAVVKRSYDPQKDFRDSMVDMIIQNDICYYKDLLGLLECYLSLNSEEYHDIIVEVFQQVWLDFMEVP